MASGLAFDVVFPGLEVEGGVGLVEHGGFVELESYGVEGFGVVAFAAGDDDATESSGFSGGYVGLGTGSGLEGFGAEGEVALAPPYCLGYFLAAGTALVDCGEGFWLWT